MYVQLHVDTASWAAIRRRTSAAWHWPRQRPHAACQSPSTHDGQDYRITIISLQWYNTVFHYCHIAPTVFTAPVKSHNRVFPYRVYLDRVSIDRVYLHPQQQLKKLLWVGDIFHAHAQSKNTTRQLFIMHNLRNPSPIASLTAGM